MAEDFGDLSSAFLPMLVDSSLNQLKVGLANCPFSDGNGQHFHCIAEQKRGRQQKMKANQKNYCGRNLVGK